jgi:hypothetical protein
MIKNIFLPATLGMILLLFTASCCKLKIIEEQIKSIEFKNFALAEVDTFYALPVFADSVIPWIDYKTYRETTTSLNATMWNSALAPNGRLEIVLKDTNVRYLINNVKTFSLSGPRRCDPLNIKIESFDVNGFKQTGKTILIQK